MWDHINPSHLNHTEPTAGAGGDDVMADQDATPFVSIAANERWRLGQAERRIAQAEGWRKIAVSDAKAWKARALKAEAENERLREDIAKLELAVVDVAMADDFYGPGGRKAKAEAVINAQAASDDKEPTDG